MAVETFTMMVNNGFPFVDALAAVYLTGIDHGMNGNKPDKKGE